ncbi:MAG: ABC transporter substrate-binding protein, partial [Bosea sp. (in: a-proteobacteria)]
MMSQPRVSSILGLGQCLWRLAVAGEFEAGATRRGLLAGSASVSVLALAGCGSGLTGIPGLDGGGGGAAPPSAGAGSAVSGPTIGAGRVRVGLILPLSAQGQGGVVGNAMRNAAELALSEFQGADLTLLVKDDMGTADGGRAAADAAIREGAEMLIGPLFAPSVQAAGQVARAANRPVIGFSTDATVAARGVYL